MIQFFKVSDKQLIDSRLKNAVIKMPQRATDCSAGYDFFSPFDFTLEPGQSITFPTGIKVCIPKGYFMMIVPRSGLGFKYQIGLANTVGIIDADYFNNPDNEGHIMAKLVNNGDKPCTISAGQAFCQGIILNYAVTDDDCPKDGTRVGGFGSTDK